jgi:hypothetical protein
MKIDPNEPSMPFDISRDGYKYNEGLSIRAHFAAIAMTGLIDSEFSGEGHELAKAENVARRAVRCADALIAELNKEKP